MGWRERLTLHPAITIGPLGQQPTTGELLDRECRKLTKEEENRQFQAALADANSERVLREIRQQDEAKAQQLGISYEEYKGILNGSPEFRQKALQNLRNNPRGKEPELYTNRRNGQAQTGEFHLFETPTPKHISPDDFLEKSAKGRLRTTRKFLEQQPGWGDTHQLLDSMVEDNN